MSDTTANTILNIQYTHCVLVEPVHDHVEGFSCIPANGHSLRYSQHRHFARQGFRICCIVVCCLRCAVLWLLLHVCSQHSNIQHHHFEAIPHHVILCFNYRFTSIYFGICRPHTLARSTTHITHAHFGRYCNVSSHSLNVINFCPFLSVMGINCINLIRIMCLVDTMVVLLFLDITALDIV